MIHLPSRRVSLDELLTSVPADLAAIPRLPDSSGAIITGLCFDSRSVQAGDIFFALTGGRTDGHRYIGEAIKRGAVAVVGERALETIPVAYIQVTDSRLALSHLAAAFYGFPARKLTVIGVTGTDGKTTTANLIYQILLAAGLRAGLISTVNAVIGDETIDTGFHVTTPEATDIQRYLSQMVSESISHVVLETTSHGLAQQRVAACEFDVGVVTNITHEHLDFHLSYDAYRAAKARLFDIIAAKDAKSSSDIRYAVLNRDDDSYHYLSEYIRQPGLQTRGEINVLSYGLNEPVDLYAEDIVETRQGASFTVVGSDFRMPVVCHLPGLYNVSNCLAAIASTVIAMEIDPESARLGINNLSSIPGRMEIIDQSAGLIAVVDFAHTPNALKRALTAARKMAVSEGKPARVIAVFGSAGLRDKAKRRMMAEISAEMADITILTAEDPRTESLDGILDEMSAGCRSVGGVEGKTFWRIRDRGQAIRFGLSMAQAGDAVIALGKGHEQSMCFGETEYAWDDRQAVRAALAELNGTVGPVMPYLPTQDNLA